MPPVCEKSADDLFNVPSSKSSTAPVGHPAWLAVLDEIRALHVKKATDYGRGADMLANLRAAAEFGLPAWLGVALRMNDKMHRLKSFAQTGKLANEGVEDSLLDIANYAMLALVLFRESQPKSE